ncbi:synaptonemal complex protein 2 [Amia ocellicauda]|uniref:synaptonemal complex protein 2 n=1 Tax=Amia ocellicauda TaxID=2972642 RepID=UPI003463B9A8
MCVGEGTENGQMAEEEAEAVEEREDSQDVLVSFDKESVLSVGTQNRSSGKSLSGKKTPRYGTTATQKVHMSGFSGTPSDTLKRLHANQGTSSSEDEDEEESNWKEQEPRMTPRKLFKPSRPDWRAEMAPMAATVKQPPHREEKASSCEEAEEEEWGERVEVPSRSKNLFRKPGLDGTGDNDIEVHSSISSHVVSTLDLNSWESSTEQDMTMMCQKFSTELKRKFQNRSRKMDSYTKQSLKSIQQHVSSVRGQVQQYRFNRLESFRGTIIEELNDFEKDVLALKNMEKELTDFWKKQSQTLSTYQKKEQRRIENLKSSFEQNACHSLEYEERLVTTEMHLMKRDMKLIQEQLFKEMQEEEFLSVRRGLQSLLLPKGRKF